MTIVRIALSDIELHASLQRRAAINSETVAHYATIVDALPPITVYDAGDANYLADGFHRYAAHMQAGREDIAAVVHDGSLREALLHALGANKAHGLPRTNEEKRAAVGALLNDREWGLWSDRKIAEHAGVSHVLVAKVRKEQTEEATARVEATLAEIEAERGAPPKPAKVDGLAFPPPVSEKDIAGVMPDTDAASGSITKARVCSHCQGTGRV